MVLYIEQLFAVQEGQGSIPADSSLFSLLGYQVEEKNLRVFSFKTALGQHTHVKKVPFVVRYRAQKVVLGK